MLETWAEKVWKRTLSYTMRTTCTSFAPQRTCLLFESIEDPVVMHEPRVGLFVVRRIAYGKVYSDPLFQRIQYGAALGTRNSA